MNASLLSSKRHLGQRPALAARTPAASSSSSASRTRAPLKVSAMKGSIDYTQYQCNSFKIKFNESGKSILIDPWFVDDLTFYGQPWLFRGKKDRIPLSEAESADMIVLTQSLDDHCHQPTLKLLNKSIPILVPPSAYGIVRDLGFKNITQLDHNQTTTVLDNKLRVRATVGALVGPPWSKRENGYVFEDTVSNVKLYYEPHCDFVQQSLNNIGEVDAVISPVKTQALGSEAVNYPLVQGKTNLVPLMRILKPSVVIPLFNAEFATEGPLSSAIVTFGSAEQVPNDFKAAGLKAVLAYPDSTPCKPRRIEIPAKGEVREVAVRR